MVELKELAKVCQSASEAVFIAQDIEVVLEALRKVGKPSRCKDLQPVIEGPKYRYTVAHIAKMLGFAKKMGLVIRTEVDGEPIEIKVNDSYTFDGDGKPDTVVVDGIIYRRTDSYPYRRKWVTVKKTIVPKIAMYSLA